MQLKRAASQGRRRGAASPRASQPPRGRTRQRRRRSTARCCSTARRARTTVLEPNVRVTRLFGASALLYGQAGFDAITGASPTGAAPAIGVQTTTTPSGNTVSSTTGQVPVAKFNDHRLLGELGGKVPLGLGFALGASGHVSRERDYRSTGGTATLTLECMQKLTTFSAGGGVNHDQVIPKVGTPVGLDSTGAITGVVFNPKRVTSAQVGVSRILSRRWMVALNANRDRESGYLTEPYKVLSVVDPATGTPTATQVKEKRPDERDRRDALLSSVYHLTNNVVYTSYRYYWDDWGVRSSTFDLKYRVNLGDHAFVQPHVRYYTQTAATFYRAELVQGEPLPAFASSDERLGRAPHGDVRAHLRAGPCGKGPGQVFVRAEYMRQTGGKGLNDVQSFGGESGASGHDRRPSWARSRPSPVRRSGSAPCSSGTRPRSDAAMTVRRCRSSPASPPWPGRARCSSTRTTPRSRSALTDVARDEALRIEHKYSRYRDDNLLFALNHSAGVADRGRRRDRVAPRLRGRLLRRVGRAGSTSPRACCAGRGRSTGRADVPTAALVRELLAARRLEAGDVGRSRAHAARGHGARPRRHRQGVRCGPRRGAARGRAPRPPSSSISGATCSPSGPRREERAVDRRRRRSRRARARRCCGASSSRAAAWPRAATRAASCSSPGGGSATCSTRRRAGRSRARRAR